MADYPTIEVDLTAKVAPATEHWKEIDALREAHRFFWNSYGSGYWVLTRYDDIREASREAGIFSNHSIVATDPEPAYRFLPSFARPAAARQVPQADELVVRARLRYRRCRRRSRSTPVRPSSR